MSLSPNASDRNFHFTGEPEIRCYHCSAWIHDDTKAKQNYRGKWACEDCLADDAEPMDPFAAALLTVLQTANSAYAPAAALVCENFAEGECETPRDNVQDYNANTPLRTKRFLCENCTINEAEQAHERMCHHHYGGSR